MKKSGSKIRRWLTATNIFAVVIAVVALLPLLWMVDTSFKEPLAIGQFPPSVFPHPFTMANYQAAFGPNNFQRFILNSAVVALASTGCVLLFGSMAGYSLGRLPMRGRVGILVVLLMISVFPEIAVISPLYLLMRDLGWLDSYQALIVPYTAFNLPFAIWILRNYFLTIPKEMEEVGRIDGASGWRILFQIIIPQATPGLFVAGTFTFTACWTELLMAISFDSNMAFRTIPVGIALFGSQFTVPYGTLFAASTVAILPVAILVVVFRRSVVSGLTQGAVKG